MVYKTHILDTTLGVWVGLYMLAFIIVVAIVLMLLLYSICI